jgi:DNA-binding winged helix-turn-helix (wHTH) protein/tetratricopeptide (TPR) repeat protein
MSLIRTYCFGPFRVVLLKRLLLKGDRPVALRSRAFDLLVTLIEQRGQTLSKSHLLELVWPETIVTENTLVVSMASLRRALGDTASSPKFVLTVPRQGYRFIADTVVDSATPFDVAVEQLPRGNEKFPCPPNTEVILFPLATFGKAESVQLAEAFSRLLVSRMPCAIRQMPSPSMDSRDSLRDVNFWGSSLFVVRGSLVASDATISITVSIVNAATGDAILRKECPLDERNLSQFVDSVCKALTPALVRLRPSGAHSTGDARADALEAYGIGYRLWCARTRSGLERACRWFEMSIKLDPALRLSHVGLADAHNLLALWNYDGLRQEHLDQASACVSRAFSMETTSFAAGHASLGFNYLLRWRWREARASFLKALELDPLLVFGRSWFADYLVASGDPGQALEQVRTAVGLDPNCVPLVANEGITYYRHRDYPSAIARLRRCIAMDQTFSSGHSFLALALVQVERCDDAIIVCKQGLEHAARDELCLNVLAYAEAKRGNRRAAEAWLGASNGSWALRKDLSAAVLSALGRDEPAVAMLHKAVTDHDPSIMWINEEPSLDGLRLRTRIPRFSRDGDFLC